MDYGLGFQAWNLRFRFLRLKLGLLGLIFLYFTLYHMKYQLYQVYHPSWHLNIVFSISFSKWNMIMSLNMTPSCGISWNWHYVMMHVHYIVHQRCIWLWNLVAHTWKVYIKYTFAKVSHVYWVHCWHFDWNPQAMAKWGTLHMV